MNIIEKILRNHSVEDIPEVLEEFMEAKIKEYDSMAKMAKVTAKIGITSAPNSIREEAINDFMNTFKKEIDEIIRRTL